MTNIPLGFHRISSRTQLQSMPITKGHVYFVVDSGLLYLATDAMAEGLEVYGSGVKNVSLNPSSRTLTITYSGGQEPKTVDLSIFADKEAVGDLASLNTEEKNTIVGAINELLQSIQGGSTGSAVTITEDTATGYSKVYTFRQGGTVIGTVNIPKDMVVSSGTVETDPSGQAPGTYLVLTLANAESDKVYINVGSLVDLYTAAKSAQVVQVSIDSESREISADIVAGSISTAHLAAGAVTDAKIADGTISLAKLASSVQQNINKGGTALQQEDIVSGTADGTISVKGTDIAVKGLQDMAYKTLESVTALIDSARDTAIASAKGYSDSLHQWDTWEE